jgi:hypothetical protein
VVALTTTGAAAAPERHRCDVAATTPTPSFATPTTSTPATSCRSGVAQQQQRGSGRLRRCRPTPPSADDPPRLAMPHDPTRDFESRAADVLERDGGALSHLVPHVLLYANSALALTPAVTVPLALPARARYIVLVQTQPRAVQRPMAPSRAKLSFVAARGDTYALRDVPTAPYVRAVGGGHVSVAGFFHPSVRPLHERVAVSRAIDARRGLHRLRLEEQGDMSLFGALAIDGGSNAGRQCRAPTTAAATSTPAARCATSAAPTCGACRTSRGARA